MTNIKYRDKDFHKTNPSCFTGPSLNKYPKLDQLKVKWWIW